MAATEGAEAVQADRTPVVPDPEMWPQCSDCGVAYVHRRALSWSKGYVWVWQQDCKHGRKGSPQPTPVIANADGPVAS